MIPKILQFHWFSITSSLFLLAHYSDHQNLHECITCAMENSCGCSCSEQGTGNAYGQITESKGDQSSGRSGRHLTVTVRKWEPHNTIYIVNCKLQFRWLHPVYRKVGYMMKWHVSCVMGLPIYVELQSTFQVSSPGWGWVNFREPALVLTNLRNCPPQQNLGENDPGSVTGRGDLFALHFFR